MVRGRSLLARSFWRLWRIVPVIGLFRDPCTCPDLETFFRENAFQHIFLEKCVPNRFWDVVLLGPSQVQACGVVSRPVPGGGSRLSLEKARTQRVAGGCPPPPQFRARSLALARFGVGCHIVPVAGLLRHLSTCPDLETFFRKNAFQHIFSGKCVPNRS